MDKKKVLIFFISSRNWDIVVIFVYVCVCFLSVVVFFYFIFYYISEWNANIAKTKISFNFVLYSQVLIYIIYNIYTKKNNKPLQFELFIF